MDYWHSLLNAGVTHDYSISEYCSAGLSALPLDPIHSEVCAEERRLAHSSLPLNGTARGAYCSIHYLADEISPVNRPGYGQLEGRRKETRLLVGKIFSGYGSAVSSLLNVSHSH